MKQSGFTLVELIAIVSLLGVLVAFAYPKVLDVKEKKEAEINQAKVNLIYNAAKEYVNNNESQFSQSQQIYCISLDTLENENLIPVDITDVKKKYSYVRVNISSNKNSYIITKTCET